MRKREMGYTRPFVLATEETHGYHDTSKATLSSHQVLIYIKGDTMSTVGFSARAVQA